MKKVLATVLLLAATSVQAGGSADKLITIPNNGIVPPNGGVLAIPLTPLFANMSYTLECTIASESRAGVRFGYSGNFNSTNPPVYFSLNDNALRDNQGMLEAKANNTITTTSMNFYKQAETNTLNISNADETPFQVTKCVAHFVVSAH